jgi:hypothetical protein
MAWTLAQAWKVSAQSGSGSTGLSLSLTSTPTTGNLIAVCLIWFDGASTSAGTVTVKDANNVNYTISPSSPGNGFGTSMGILYLAYLQVPATPNGTINLTYGNNGASGNCIAWAAEYSNAQPWAFDSDGKGSGNGTAVNSPTLSVAAAGDLCIAVALDDHAISTVGGSWNARVTNGTSPGSLFGEGIADILNQGSNVAVNMTQSATGNWETLAASFKLSAAQDTPELYGRPYGQFGQREMQQLLAN